MGGCESRAENSSITKRKENILTDKILLEFNSLDRKNTHSNQIIDYSIIKAVGRGTTATVYKVQSLKSQDTDKFYALKEISKSCLTERILEEIEIHILLNRRLSLLDRNTYSPIIGLHHCFEDNDNVYLLLEYVEGKELYSKVIDNNNISETEATHIFGQIVQGIESLHQIGVFHRDLKLSNIMLCQSTNEIKIVDYGLATKTDIDQELDTFCGTPNYIAPEMLLNEKYDIRTDIWSLGCILYAILSGRPPFQQGNVQLTLDNIKTGNYKVPKNRSKSAQNLIFQMLQKDANSRIKIDEILEHKFFEEYMAKKINSTSYSSQLSTLENSSQDNSSENSIKII